MCDIKDRFIGKYFVEDLDDIERDLFEFLNYDAELDEDSQIVLDLKVINLKDI